ncbi:hypothetical protein HZC31_04585 [Candidatus Woesearchaeota archaeon]|nr:hypothetical protein [Candidatus Woesearchaeota archaeon]
MAKQKSDLYATSTIGAAGIIGMLLMMVFADGFSFSFGGYDLSGQAIAGVTEKTPYDAGLEAGYTQCLKDDGKYTEKQAVKKMDTSAMNKQVALLTGLAVGDTNTPSCTDTDMDVQGGTTVPVKGSVTAEGKTMYDLCKDKSIITEYYCTADGKAASYPLTCPTGTMCKDATCVVTDTTGQTSGQQTGQTGTTSGQQTGTTQQSGQQAGQTTTGQQGTASGAGQTSGSQQSGSQQTNQNTQVSEAEKKKAEEEYKKGYEDGYKKCIDEKKAAATSQNTQTGQTQTSQTTQALCTDSDGGNEPTVYGEIYDKLQNVIHTDKCSTTNVGYPYLAELYCEDDQVKSAIVDCAELGLVCDQGACVSNT